FVRNDKADDVGHPNDLSGLDTILCVGASQSGKYLRDFIYQGFNEDEEGRRVCDGVHITVAGGEKVGLDYRFAASFHGGQPARLSPRAKRDISSKLCDPAESNLSRSTRRDS